MGCKMNDVNRHSLYGRVNKLLVSYDWSDCTFLVSGRKFKAHKLILGISSPVFEAMFYGPLSNQDEISITDIEPEIFQLLLTYIYTDRVELTSIDDAFELLYVSKKYLLEHLTETCTCFIQMNVTVENVVTVLNYPEYFSDNTLIETSLRLLCEHANYVIKDNLETITGPCMQKILCCDEMNIKEKELIKYVFQWTVCQCKRKGIAFTAENRRRILTENKLLKSLRLLTLSIDDMEEILKDENNLLLPGDSLGTASTTRNPIELHWSLCHRSLIRSTAPLLINPQNNSITTRIKANKTAFINSFSIPSRMAPDLNLHNSNCTEYIEFFFVTISTQNDVRNIMKFSVKIKMCYDAHHDIQIPQPISMKKDVWYTVEFVWPTSELTYAYATQSRNTHYNNGKIQFDFEDVPAETGNCGSFLKGLNYCM